jgi:hypothetical protein
VSSELNLGLWEQHAYAHAAMCSNQPPLGSLHRAIFGMLVALDFECYKYGDAPEASEQAVKEWLLEHREEALLVSPPTYMGLMAGVFNFLFEEAVT